MRTKTYKKQPEVDNFVLEKPFYCQSVDDFYSPSAKRTMQWALAKFLLQNRIGITELLHRTDMVSKLENSDMVLQHAIQKVALERAKEGGPSVVDTIRQLNGLTAQVAFNIRHDNRVNAMADIACAEFSGIAEALLQKEGGTLLLEGVISRYIRNALSWGEKVGKLGELLDSLPTTAAHSPICYAIVDEMIAELLQFSAVCQDFLQIGDSVGASLLALISVVGGIRCEANGQIDRCLTFLAEPMAAGFLPRTRDGLAAVILAEIESPKKLHFGVIDDELQMFRRVAGEAAKIAGRFIFPEALRRALEVRSGRYLASAALTERLSYLEAPEDKLEWLLFVDKNICGARNAIRLAGMAMQIVSSPKFANALRQSRTPVAQRLQRLMSLCAQLSASNCPQAECQQITDIIENVAFDLASEAKIFETVDAMPVGPVEKTLTLLRILASGRLGEGKFSGKMREVLVAYMSWPGFLAAYIADISKHAGGRIDISVTISDLKKRLEKVGIPPEVCLRPVA